MESVYGGRGPTVNGILWTETALAAIFALLRIYTRKAILHSLGLDDMFLFLTFLLLALYSAFISAATRHGLGRRRAEISMDSYAQAMKFEIMGQAACILNIATARAAVAFFLLRIVVERRHKVFVWACIITNSAVATLCTVAVLAQCRPMQAIWDVRVKGECNLDFPSIGLTTSIYAVIVDFTLAIFPCIIIWDLNMKRKDKLLTICGLGLGVFSGICGIMRSIALRSLTSLEEYIFDTVDMLIYSGTENFVSVMCASIPVLRPLWHKVRGYTTANKSTSSDSYRLRCFRANDLEEAGSGVKADSGAGRRDDEVMMTTGATTADELSIYVGNNPGGQRRFETTVERAGSEESTLGSTTAPSLQNRGGAKGVVHIQRDFSINVTGQLD
ncbi:hypothetical protein MAPG_09347 [Magnaporthiopsis poae ATCC 64411]|uniref:Rhodopsin domain-containing protein n=1 Tax=Magnaporthiopsis poae (strain ATCC 64411 / 73-15) TaxID=644358 RepID=A0A0C4E9Q1_MAGP6|nr:hypothetical protein MAPG_09347 [Magnaporthiopsis poae ATCC 64411]